MFSKFILTALVSLFLLFDSFGQKSETAKTVNDIFGDRGEIFFQFNYHQDDLAPLSKVISIDKVDGISAYAYANKSEFEAFLKYDLPFALLPKPGEMIKNPRMLDEVNVREISEWDFYPAYGAYVDMMYQFQTDYPELCEVFSIGQSTQGRELMMAKISKNVSVREAEPQFLYTGTIHGDETAGYVLLLRLIDYLLENYGTDTKVTSLLDNSEIWINPNANPDGTYAGGNNSVYGATRYNANNVDLNRNFPDPEDGPNPDGNPWQPETIAFMQLAEDNHFVMSANTHGGAEVLNYPWDTWPQLAADNDWWVFVCRQYVDTVHLYSSPGYLSGFDNGITNGYAWYSIDGGRQDFMNYFHHCREVTLELTNTKLYPAAQLPTLWDWSYRSLLNYIEQSTFGVAGLVTNLDTGDPLPAKVSIEGHDIDNSFVYADQSTGFYQRLLEAGTYDLTFSAPGHYPQTVENVSVSRYSTITLNVQLDAGELAADFSASATTVAIGGSVDFQDESFGYPVSWEWHFPGGNPSNAQVKNPENIIYQNAGSFDVTLTVTDSDGNQETTTKQNFITVNAEYLMSNQTVTTCNGMFFDTGGAVGNYSNNESFTMTFMPENPESNIIVEFLSFDVEDHSSCNYDWLKVYDGPGIASPLIGTYCGTSSPGTIEATGASGALTFQFESDFSVTRPGWEAIISCSFAGLPPVADFMADQTEILIGDTVHFTDLSGNIPESWYWEFEGGVPATSTQQHPVVSYPVYGLYDVKLTVQNAYGTDSVLYVDFIKVDSVIGIAETSGTYLQVFPNPSRNGQLWVTSSALISEIRFYDLNGKMKIHYETSPSSAVKMSAEGLGSGVYLLKVLTGYGWHTTKVMIGK
jgi:PKD repeat protein